MLIDPFTLLSGNLKVKDESSVFGKFLRSHGQCVEGRDKMAKTQSPPLNSVLVITGTHETTVA